jgi:hypothetical protein
VPDCPVEIGQRKQQVAGQCRISSVERCPHFDTDERPSTLKQGQSSGLIGRRNASNLTEIALHYENSGVVAEANFPTELFGTLKNVVHQLFR